MVAAVDRSVSARQGPRRPSPHPHCARPLLVRRHDRPIRRIMRRARGAPMSSQIARSSRDRVGRQRAGAGTRDGPRRTAAAVTRAVSSRVPGLDGAREPLSVGPRRSSNCSTRAPARPHGSLRRTGDARSADVPERDRAVHTPSGRRGRRRPRGPQPAGAGRPAIRDITVRMLPGQGQRRPSGQTPDGSKELARRIPRPPRRRSREHAP